MNGLKTSLLVASIVFLACLLLGCANSSMNEAGNRTNETQTVKAYQCPNGQVVENLSDCMKCPSTCDDNNPCSMEYCNASTNYTCQHASLDNLSCGENRTCVNGECAMLRASNESARNPANTSGINADTNATVALAAGSAPSIAHLDNESRASIYFINKKRFEVYIANSQLNESQALDAVAQRCNNEMLSQNSSDPTVCYRKFGSFNELFGKIGFYGQYFVYVSRVNQTPANETVSDLYWNLTAEERNLLA
ncbi:MAG: hypothetical protein KGH63_03860, partial [Candidatus Micrarchaeota archaeon]|nr:hypothetical protein [Candidatus Micrarchaeota archaeon]